MSILVHNDFNTLKHLQSYSYNFMITSSWFEETLPLNFLLVVYFVMSVFNTVTVVETCIKKYVYFAQYNIFELWIEVIPPTIRFIVRYTSSSVYIKLVTETNTLLILQPWKQDNLLLPGSASMCWLVPSKGPHWDHSLRSCLEERSTTIWHCHCGPGSSSGTRERTCPGLYTIEGLRW